MAQCPKCQSRIMLTVTGDRICTNRYKCRWIDERDFSKEIEADFKIKASGGEQ